jgi:hypothetical protein
MFDRSDSPYNSLLSVQVIVCNLLTIISPILLTSAQVAVEGPGLPFGIADIRPGRIRTLAQVLMVFLSPITLLLLRLQHGLIKEKWQLLKDTQNKHLIPEFNRLGSILKSMEIQKTKGLSMSLANTI